VEPDPPTRVTSSAAGGLRRSTRTILLVALGGYLVRVLVIALVDPHVPPLGDASAYHLLANNLADGHGYIRPFDLLKFGRIVPTAEYPPLHPFVLSLFARLGLRDVEAQRIALALFGAATVALVGFVGRRIAGHTVGITAASIAAVSPMMFLPETTLMSETLFVFLVTLALLLALQARDDPDPARLAVLGLVLGLAALTRAEALLFGLLLLSGLAWRHRGAGPSALAWPAVGIAVMLAVVAPWTFRNQATFHRAVLVSNNVGTALAGANCAPTYSGPYLGSWRSTFGAGDTAAGQCFTGFNGRRPGFNEAVAADAARRQGLDYARSHLGRLPVVAAARVLRTFGVFRPAQQIELEALEGRPRRLEQLGTWLEWALYPFAIAGFVLLVRRRAPYGPLAATVVTVVVASLATYGNQRFRIGAEPAVIVAAAVALASLFPAVPDSPTTAVPSVE
jgi:4-amino-4-deoxy-L-arabinose transferase-like glycosyltransferase